MRSSVSQARPSLSMRLLVLPSARQHLRTRAATTRSAVRTALNHNHTYTDGKAPKRAMSPSTTLGAPRPAMAAAVHLRHPATAPILASSTSLKGTWTRRQSQSTTAKTAANVYTLMTMRMVVLGKMTTRRHRSKRGSRRGSTSQATGHATNCGVHGRLLKMLTLD